MTPNIMQNNKISKEVHTTVLILTEFEMAERHIIVTNFPTTQKKTQRLAGKKELFYINFLYITFTQR